MLQAKHFRLICFACALILLVVAFGLLFIHEQHYCLNVPLISGNDLSQYTEITSLDITQLMFDGMPVPADPARNTIYISQPNSKLLSYSSLYGSLSAANPAYSLFFVDDLILKNLTESVRQNIPLQLLIVCGTEYQRVNVFITTLPVLCLTEQDGTPGSGAFTLFGCSDPNNDPYLIRSSTATWHLRGFSSVIYPQKTWKLNLTNESGKKQDVALLDLGSDDDWILKPFSTDDTKLKEMFTQTVWNQLAAQTDYNLPMSTGRYVEVLINNSYQGLYMLQRRVDEKYLELNKEHDILFKGKNTWTAATLQDGYELQFSPIDQKAAYAELGQLLSAQNPGGINTRNVIDVTLLLQLIAGDDNKGYKNMFYVIQRSNGASVLTLVPWDTDLSLGVPWQYDYNHSMSLMPKRPEMAIIEQYTPDLFAQTANRWAALREDVFSQQNLNAVLDRLSAVLLASGAVQRDYEQWGDLHDGNDTLENLTRFINERLLLLDQYYS